MNHLQKPRILLALFLFLFLNPQLRAQVTAVMTVTVNVISGAMVQQPEEIYLTTGSSKFTSGKVFITSSPNTDVSIYTEEKFDLQNNLGKKITLSANSQITSDLSSGEHSLFVNGSFPQLNQGNGNYKGSITTVINYL